MNVCSAKRHGTGLAGEGTGFAGCVPLPGPDDTFTRAYRTANRRWTARALLRRATSPQLKNEPRMTRPVVGSTHENRCYFRFLMLKVGSTDVPFDDAGLVLARSSPFSISTAASIRAVRFS